MRVRQAILAGVIGLTAIQVWPNVGRAQNIDFGRLLGGALQSAIEADGPRQRPDQQRGYIRERQPESQPGPLDDLRAAPQSIPMPQPMASIPPSIGPSQYLVEGQRVGSKVDLSGNNSDFRCAPSEAFPGQTWCQRKRDNGPKGSGSSSSSVLYTPDAIVRYANRFIDTASFGPGDVDGQIARLSRNFREQARVMTLPPSGGMPNAVIAVWGKLQLVSLDPDSIQTLASGGSLKAGLLIDYFGDFRRSARLGQPVYRIVGGPGYIWAASYDVNGRGTLRLTAADLTGLGSDVPISAAAPAMAGTSFAGSRPQPVAPMPSGNLGSSEETFSSSGSPLASPRIAQADTPLASGQPASPVVAMQGSGTISPVQTVIAQGLGSDVESATKNAAENALTQVVGSFIDSEKMLEKRSQIVDGIRSETKRIQSNVREYSQGSIKDLEIVDTAKEGGLVRVQARVTVRVEDFKAYIKKVAVGETSMGAGLFAQIATAHSQQQNLEGLLKDRIIAPISSGEVVRIQVGSPVPFSNSGLGERLDPVSSAGRAISQMNPVLTVVFPVEVSLDDAFGQNLARTLESTATDKLRQQEELPLNRMCQMFREQDGAGRGGGSQRANVLSQNDTGVKVLASSSWLSIWHSGGGNVVTETYKMSNVRFPEHNWNPPKLDFQIIDKSGAVLWERFFTRDSGNDNNAKAVILPSINYEDVFLPWTLIREDRGCVFIARRGKFNIIAEIDPDTLKNADRASVKFSQ